MGNLAYSDPCLRGKIMLYLLNNRLILFELLRGRIETLGMCFWLVFGRRTPCILNLWSFEYFSRIIGL